MARVSKLNIGVGKLTTIDGGARSLGKEYIRLLEEKPIDCPREKSIIYVARISYGGRLAIRWPCHMVYKSILEKRSPSAAQVPCDVLSQINTAKMGGA